MYQIGNKKLKKLQTQAWNRFLRFKATTKFDELNIINNSKTLYKDLDNYTRRELLQLAQEVYKDVTKELFDKDALKKDIPTSAYVMSLLRGYNGTTKYVYTHEVDRKQSRFAEKTIVDGIMLKELQTAYKQWMKQVEEYVIDAERDATIKAMEDNGIKEVMWITEGDNKVCEECDALNGQIFPIGAIPPRPHINCRCEIRVVKGSENNDDRS